MGKKACIFVDGENLRHSIVELFPEFDQSDYLPKSAQWGSWFDDLVGDVDTQAERVRTYWYVIEHLDCFPYKFPDPIMETQSLRWLLSKNHEFADELNDLSGTSLIETMREIVRQLKEKENRMRRRFNGWTNLQNGISVRHPAIEFRRAGSINYNLYSGELGEEKAVDVKLATDMIILKDIYDIALIVSGDQDYVPAVQVVKDFGKRVINVAFEARNGKLFPGGVGRLNQKTDWSLQIKHSDLQGRLFPPRTPHQDDAEAEGEKPV